MGKKKKKDNTPQMFDDVAVPDIEECDVVSPGPQTLYKGTAYPVKELKGQREYFGGPSVVRLNSAYEDAEKAAYADSEECQGLEQERRELKDQGVKVAGRKQSCKPRIYRVGTEMDQVADCKDTDPELVPRISVTAKDGGLDGLVAPQISNNKSSEVLVFQPQTTTNLTGVRMLGDDNASIDARQTNSRSFFKSPPKPRKPKKKKSGRPAWASRGEQRGLL